MKVWATPVGVDGTAGPPDLALPAADDVLAAVGGVVYEWSIPDDRIRWGADPASVLKVPGLAGVVSGRGFAALLDPGSRVSREDAVLGGAIRDEGSGVTFEVQYALQPAGPDGERVWIEDVGRWYADASGRAIRAVGMLRVINERHEREQRLSFLSHYDELTGFFNHAHLTATLGEALTNAKRYRGAIGFMIVAVDNFGGISEAYGFDVADQLLAAVARRIKSTLRTGDAIGRYSGNKLGLVLLDCGEAEMDVAAERFHTAVRAEPIVTAAGSVAVTVSIGGVSLPRHAATTNEAVARAQEGLHIARQRGAGQFVAYAHSAERVARRQGNAALSTELVAALNEKRIRLAFQPVVEIGNRAVRFHEALVRLERPDGTLVDAGAFAELSERLGLIRLIDRRVLDLAIGALKACPRETPLRQHIGRHGVGQRMDGTSVGGGRTAA